jgi:hypothetical protein
MYPPYRLLVGGANMTLSACRLVYFEKAEIPQLQLDLNINAGREL